MDRFGATPEEWAHFDLCLGLTADLLPVVANPKAVVSENSSIKQLGKLPSIYNKNRKVIGLTGWTDRISTAQDIDTWSKEPDYGICLTGKTIKFFDIDIDDRDISAKIAFFIAERLGVLPMRTRANSGKLLLAFALPGEFPKRTLKTKHGVIEFLANKQQAVVAGTHTSGARYTWLPALPDEIPEITPAQFEKCWLELSAAFGIADPDEGSIRNPVSSTNFLPDPVADFLLANWENYGIGKEHEVRIRCPFKDDHSVDNGPSETVYFRAGTRDYEQGNFACLHAHCQDKTNSDFEIATSYTASDFEEIKDDPQTTTQFTPIRADIFAARPPVQWLIKNILPRDGLGMTYGGSGDGKTFVIVDMVLSLCLGKPWNGHKTVQGHCVYICAEGAGGFTSRLRAYAQQYEHDLKNIGDYLTIIPETPNFRTDKDVKAIAQAMNNLPYKVDLIIIDTLAQVTPGADENTGKDMSIAIRHTELLGSLTGATPHLIHHAGKDENKGARGWSGMKGPLAVQFAVSREGDNRLFWIAKLKDGRDGFGYNFRLQDVAIGRDIDDEEMTSCYVEYVGKAGSKKSNIDRKLGKWQQAAADAWDHFGGSDVLAEDLLQEAVKRIQKPDGRDIRREKCREGILSVIAKAGYFIHDGKIVSDLSSK